MGFQIKKNVLVVDDDFIVRKTLSSLLSGKYGLVEASNYTEAVEAFNKNEISLIILDIFLNDERTGIDLLTEFKRLNSTVPVIMLSSNTDLDKVITCMKLGATDYIAKTDLDGYEGLAVKIHNCFKKELEARVMTSLERNFDENNPVVFQSNSIKRIIKEIESVEDMNIIMEGETGVGKTPLARYANTFLSKSTNTVRPFVRINCAGLSRERLQADLFGHRKGAFTGAVTDNKGLVELAKDGDLFMDEIGDMDPACQSELLVFLDSGEYRRVGDPVTRHSNCRIIAATNTNLKERVDKGLFRKDLYSRLAQCKLFVPPLRERKEDIVPIMNYYIESYFGYLKPYSKDVLGVYLKHDWQEGNVRELRDAVRYMCVKAKNEKEIGLQHLNSDYYYSNSSPAGRVVIDTQNIKDSVMELGYDNYIDSIERLILDRLAQDEKSINSLSKKIKTSDVTLWRKFKKYNISIN